MKGRAEVGRVRDDSPLVPHLCESGVDAAVSGVRGGHDVAAGKVGAKRETFPIGSYTNEPLAVQKRLTKPRTVRRVDRDSDVDGATRQLVTDALSVVAHEPDLGLRVLRGHGAKERRSERDHELIAHGDDDDGGAGSRRRVGDEAPQRSQGSGKRTREPLRARGQNHAVAAP